MEMNDSVLQQQKNMEMLGLSRRKMWRVCREKAMQAKSQPPYCKKKPIYAHRLWVNLQNVPNVHEISSTL